MSNSIDLDVCKNKPQVPGDKLQPKLKKMSWVTDNGAIILKGLTL